METQNDTTELVTRQTTEIEIGEARLRIRNMWNDFRIKKSKGGTFVHFNDYRYSLGGRGIWGTKIFFRALIEIGLIVECDEEEPSKGRYCPSEAAMNRYENIFRWDEESEIWGLSEQHLDDFEEQIMPALLQAARKLEVIFDEEKKANSRAKYAARRVREAVAMPLEGITRI